MWAGTKVLYTTVTEVNNLLGPLLDTRMVLDNALKEIQGLAIYLPLVGKSAVSYVRPTLDSLIHHAHASRVTTHS